MSLPEIESAIEKLDSHEYDRLLAWLEARDNGRKLEWLRDAVAVAMEDSARGDRVDGRAATAEVIARVDRRIAALQRE